MKAVTRPLGRARRRMLARSLKTLAGADRRANAVALHHVFTQYASPRALCYVPFSDHAIVCDPRDDKIAMTLLAGRPWQRGRFETALAIVAEAGRLQSGGHFIDAGANIGTTAIYAMRSGWFTRTLAFEPEPRNAEIFACNMQINGLSDLVELRQAALSDAEATAELTRDGQNLGGHALDPAQVHRPAGETVSVETVRLDDVLRRKAIDPGRIGLVKIDVEGHEVAALAGMPGVIERSVPLMIEVTGIADRKGITARGQAFFEIIAPRYGFVVDLGSTTRIPVLLSQFVPSGAQQDLLVY